jgi:hypothetical protein
MMDGTELADMHKSSQNSLLGPEKNQAFNSSRPLSPESIRYNSTTKNGFSLPDSWLLESLSIISSILCQGAIIGVLISMHNKPLTDWNGLVSLNTTVAILTTASKSLFLLPVAECISQSKWHHFCRPRRMFDFDIFDNASRGPLGSFVFLFRKQTVFTFTSIGALVTLLALAVDPFAQQVLSFQQRSVSVGLKTASFGYSSTYDNGGTANALGATPDCK